MEALDDQQLVRDAQEGSTEAFAELVRRHQRAALRLATVVSGSADDADDIAQEAFVKAHRALHRFREGAEFRPWMFRIVANTAKNHRRAAGRRARLAIKAASMAPPAPQPGVEAHDRRQWLVAALNRLGAGDRMVLALRYFEEMTEREMAEVMGCRPGTVKSRLSRAMGRLRAALDEEDADA